MSRSSSTVFPAPPTTKNDFNKKEIDKSIADAKKGNDQFKLDKTILEAEHLVEHEKGVTTVSFNKDSSLMATGSKDTTVRVFKAIGEEGNKIFKEVKVIKDSGGPVRSVQFSPNGNFLAIGSEDEKVYVYRVEGDDFERINTLKGKFGQVFSVGFNHTGNLFAVGSSDKKVRIY